MLEDPRLDWDLLESNGFERARFETDHAAIVAGTLTENSSLLSGNIEPYDEVLAIEWSDATPSRWAHEAGTAALADGQIASVVLNGGMATRFGNVVKGTVEVFDGNSFLALKAQDALHAADRYGTAVPLVLMNSFATEHATAEHTQAAGCFGLAEGDLLSFRQTISLRMNPDGSLFIGDDGKPSYHAPGHGDFFNAIRNSGILAKLRERGVRFILFSNVDNLGATIDPTVIGFHRLSSADMTAEVTAKRRTASGQWDKGGAPALVDGRRQLVEGFRLPKDLAPTHLPDFSTNNFIFNLEAIDREVPLERHVVRKVVDDRPALQLESIACEASAIYPDGGDKPLLSLGVGRVPRDDEHGRFFPIKERVDLDAMRDALRARLEASWQA